MGTTDTDTSQVLRAPAALAVLPGEPAGTVRADRHNAPSQATLIYDWAASSTSADFDFLFRELKTLVGAAFEEDRAEAVEALQACQRDLGGLAEPPSRDRYRGWLARQAPLAQWPSAYEIEKAFGTFSRAREASCGLVVPIEAVNATKLGTPPERSQLLDMLLRWHGEEPDPRRRHGKFRGWLRGALQRDGLVCGLSYAPDHQAFASRFGNWAEAIAAAGLISGMTFVDYLKLIATMPPYGRDRLLERGGEWAVWADRNGRRMTQRSLREYRRRVLHDAWSRGEVCQEPSPQTLCGNFGSFRTAVREIAGDHAVFSRTHGCRSEWTPRLVADWVRVAAAKTELGKAMRERDYRPWRQQVLAQTNEPVPHPGQVRKHLKAATFEDAVGIALDHREPTP